MVTIHDIFHLAMPQYVKGPHKRAYAKGLFMVIARKAGTVVCSSDYTLSEVKRLTKIDHSKLHRVHLGVDEAWFDAVPERNPHPEPYLLYVGNVKPHKNLRALLSAYRMIEGEIPHDLVIVGKNEGFITGDAQVAEEARLLGGRVKFTGSISLAVLRQYVIHADCLVLPSLYEGFGLPPLEAMACGCPTIVSTAASLPEVCGDASLYIDPHRPEDIAAKIKMLLNDEALRSELRSKGRQQAARFGWEKTADEMIEICEGLLGA
jgi:glycosyltransferase involved in cell wall biosynthesis